MDNIDVERMRNGQIMVATKGRTLLVLSEDTAMVFAKALQMVAVSNPPKVAVIRETDRRGADLKY